MKINQMKYTVEQINEFGQYYKNGHSLKETAEYFDVNYHTLKQILLKFGFRTTSKTLINQRVSKVTYFDIIDSHEKAYWLGFMYSDGYISKSAYGCSIGLALQLQDKYIIERFKTVLNIPNKIGEYKNSCKLCFTCLHALKSLQNLGIVFDKSHEDYTIPNIPNEFINSFILGYFDGDGCITIKSTGYSVVSICSNSKTFLESLKTHLETKGIICRNICKEKRANDLYVLYLSKRENQIKFADYIYKDCPTYLFRKHDKFLQIPR